MTVSQILSTAYRWGPVLFGIGFIAPLIVQTLEAQAIARPLGVSTIQFGLAIGVSAGLVAKRRGRWV